MIPLSAYPPKKRPDPGRYDPGDIGGLKAGQVAECPHFFGDQRAYFSG
jgi:hypothetical protein